MYSYLGLDNVSLSDCQETWDSNVISKCSQPSAVIICFCQLVDCHSSRGLNFRQLRVSKHNFSSQPNQVVQIDDAKVHQTQTSHFFDWLEFNDWSFQVLLLVSMTFTTTVP